MTRPFTPTTFGKYVLLERLASGGMAEIFRAVQRGAEGLDRTVALKRVLPVFGDEPEFTALFKDEARIALTLTHANIAQTFDFGEVDGAYYLALELVEGIDLSRLGDRLRAEAQPMPMATASFVVAEAARGLAYAHDKRATDGGLLGIVHRDVSPQNILLSYAGEVKVADFGIAKAAGKLHKTATGVVMGKLRYMSPEQLAGVALDPRSDVFSLGVILYELLTGGPIFPEEGNLAELIHAAPIEPPSLRHPGIPPELDRIVLKALGRPRDTRYARAADLARDLTVYVNQTAPEFTREDLGALVARMAPPARSAAAPELVASAGGVRGDATPAAKRSAAIVNETAMAPTTPVTPSRPAEAVAAPAPVRQLDLATRTRLPSPEPSQRLPRRRRTSRAAKAGVALALVILGSGALVVVRFVLPGQDAPAAAVDAAPGLAAASDSGPPSLADAGAVAAYRPFELTASPLDAAALQALDGAVQRHGVTGFIQLDRLLAVYLTALDFRIATLLLDDGGRPVSPDAPYPEEWRKLIQDQRVGPAVDAVVAYVRATGKLPLRARKALETVLGGGRSSFGVTATDEKGGSGQIYSAAALAAWLQPRNPARLVELARANDALGRWCDPPATGRHFAPLACELPALAEALRAAGDAATADALERWQAAAPVDPRRALRYQPGLDGKTLTLAVEIPDSGDVVVSGAALRGPRRPVGGRSVDAGTGWLVFELDRGAFALVLEVGGTATRLPSPPPGR